MRIALVAFLVAVSSGFPEQVVSAEPKAVIEKAIQAYGGEAHIAKLKVVRAKAKGTVNLGADVPFTWEFAWQAPSHFRLMAELEAASKKVAFTQGYDGRSAWGQVNGATADVQGKKLDELKAQINLRRVLMLTPLLTDKIFELTGLDDVMVNDKPASGVKVSALGERDIKLYFDQQTGLLAKLERLVYEDAKKQEVLQEDFPSDFKDIDGLKTAMKEVWMRSGKKVAELQFVEVTYPEKIDIREFARPAGGLPPDLPITQTTDVIYGRKFGMALTMDVLAPKTGANGKGIVFVISGGWVSNNQALNSTLIGNFVAEPIRRGYTVFAIYLGSQPKFTIPECISDVNRAVRYIRHHARDYQIDPNRIGITGGSAGGHLSLMQGTAGDLGDPNATDLVDRESSRVQAVACLFPPTDFLNYGGEGKYAFGLGELLASFRPAVDVRELDPKTLQFERPTDSQKHLDLAAKISPITHVSADDPPTLIVHGDADVLVPIQQAELFIAKLKAVGVRAELITRKGRGHNFAEVSKDITVMTDWFDEHLKK